MSEAVTPPEELARQALSPWPVTFPEYDNLFDAIELACIIAQREARREAERTKAICIAMMLRDTAKTQCFGKEETKATLLAIADSIEASEGVNDDE